MTLPPLAFDVYEANPPAAYAGNPIWRTRMFRMASYLSTRCATDAAALGARVSLATAQQFVRATTSISANIAEGYSRGDTADRRRFYTYALGSTREAIAWIDALGDTAWPPRQTYLDLLVQIRRQLLTALKSLRAASAEKRNAVRRATPIVYRNPKSES
jgi:four helix bundle protein